MTERKLEGVVTGTDFSETSRGAVSEAVRLVAGRPGGRLFVVHVLGKSDDQAPDLEERLVAFALGLDSSGALTPDQVHPRIVRGAVAEGIAAVAEAEQADLIVVGPLQKGFVQRYLTGGTAEQLFGLTRVPVLATRGAALGGYNHILVPVDFNDHTAKLLAVVATLARDEHGACGVDPHLELVHAYVLPGGVAAMGARKELEANLEADLTANLEALAAEVGATDLIRSNTVVPGVASEVIPRLARSRAADLICMGSAGGSGIGRHLLGSTTSAVLSEVELPLLVVWA